MNKGQAGQVIELSEVPRSRVERGRPPRLFSRAMIDALPEKGSQRAYARALGVTLGALQQWMEVGDPLPHLVDKKNNVRVIDRDKLVAWLAANGRIV